MYFKNKKFNIYQPERHSLLQDTCISIAG